MTDLPPGVIQRKSWFELPDGEKVHGFKALERALAERAQNGQNGNGATVRASNENFTLQRLDFARRAGLQYGGDRDIYTVAGYNRSPSYQDYWGYYDRHPVAARIIDMPAKTTWRHPPEIKEPEQEDGTEFTEAFDSLVKRLKLWARLEKADRKARIGRFAVLFLGVRDGIIGDDAFMKPMGALSGPEDVIYLSHFGEDSVYIDTWVTDSMDERYAMPEFYQIDFSRSGGYGPGRTGFQAGTKKVHWSRVIHIAEDPLDDDVFGRPILRRLLNTVFNDEKVEAATAEAFWQLADKILQLNIDKEATVSDTELEAAEERIAELYHNLRKFYLMQGGELSWLGGDSPDPTGVADMLFTKLAIGADIPKRILMGSERGELASSQDERNFFGTVAERQRHHAEPCVLRPLIERLIEARALPPPGEDGYEVAWPPLYMPTDQEIADRNALHARTAKDLTPVGGDPYELVVVEDGVVSMRDSEEVWDERDREPGDPLPLPALPGPPEGDEGAPPAAGEEPAE